MKYSKLVKTFPLRPIQNDEGLDKAIAMLDTLIDKPRLNQDELDYREVLGLLIHDYESTNHPMPTVPGVEMLRHLLETNSVAFAKRFSMVPLAFLE